MSNVRFMCHRCQTHVKARSAIIWLTFGLVIGGAGLLKWLGVIR